jgi:hypothetical protein
MSEPDQWTERVLPPWTGKLLAIGGLSRAVRVIERLTVACQRLHGHLAERDRLLRMLAADCRGPVKIRALIAGQRQEIGRLRGLLTAASNREAQTALENSRLRQEVLGSGPADPGCAAAVAKAIHRLDKVSTMVLHWATPGAPQPTGVDRPEVVELVRLLKEALNP